MSLSVLPAFIDLITAKHRYHAVRLKHTIDLAEECILIKGAIKAVLEVEIWRVCEYAVDRPVREPLDQLTAVSLLQCVVFTHYY